MSELDFADKLWEKRGNHIDAQLSARVIISVLSTTQEAQFSPHKKGSFQSHNLFPDERSRTKIHSVISQEPFLYSVRTLS